MNASPIKISKNQEEKNVVLTREQVQTIIKENGSNLVSLNKAITKKIIVNWEAIVKLAQGV